MKNPPIAKAPAAATHCARPRRCAAAPRSSAVAATLCLLPLLAPAWSIDALVPGADLSDCRSALQPGPTVCNDIDDPQASMPTGRGADTMGARPVPGLEDRVDAYLASYGKPPREAVRALLDPSEENIRAYLKKQQQTLAIAAYVAARMTALQQAEQPQPAGLGAGTPRDAESFQQIRVWLVTGPRDPQAHDALLALRALARQFPLLQAGVQLVGTSGPAQLREEISRIDPVLSVGVVAPASVDPGLLPFVRIEDLRNRRAISVAAPSLTAEHLVRAIAALRLDPIGSQASAAASVDMEAGP